MPDTTSSVAIGAATVFTISVAKPLLRHVRLAFKGSRIVVRIRATVRIGCGNDRRKSR